MTHRHTSHFYHVYRRILSFCCCFQSFLSYVCLLSLRTHAFHICDRHQLHRRPDTIACDLLDQGQLRRGPRGQHHRGRTQPGIGPAGGAQPQQCQVQPRHLRLRPWLPRRDPLRSSRLRPEPRAPGHPDRPGHGRHQDLEVLGLPRPHHRPLRQRGLGGRSPIRLRCRARAPPRLNRERTKPIYIL